MRARKVLVAALILGSTSIGVAETIIDVGQQWREHASSVPVSGIPSAELQASTTPGAVPPSPEPAISCGCESLTTPEKLARATYAFTGRIEEVRSPKKGRRTILVDVDEIFKGSPKPEMEIVMDAAGTECDLVIEEGKTYLVYAQWQWGSAVTARCLGTKLIEKARSDASALGPSEAMKEKLYIQLHNACMGRMDTPCCLSSLKAMREGYYVPEPEAGCSSGTIPDRLRCGGSYTWCVPLSEKTHR